MAKAPNSTMAINIFLKKRPAPPEKDFFPLTSVRFISSISFFYNKKFVRLNQLLLYICTQFTLFVNMNNSLTHTKQFAFHAPITSGVYAVGFDVFTFSPRPRRRPVC